jgi:CHRD domain
MKRLFAPLLGVIVLATVGLAVAQAKAPSPKKTVVCHATSSAKRPYVRVVVGTRASLRHHLQHARDIVNPAGGTCPTQRLTAAKGGVELSAMLTPVAPNTVGSGTFVLRSNLGQGMLCFRLTVSGLANVTAAHIHYGTGPNAGGIAVPLPLPSPFAGSATGCVQVDRTLLRQILSSPQDYYVNVHTTAFPAGAIKGTLTR